MEKRKENSVSDGKDKKLVLMQKQMILTSKQRAEHLFAGRKTQQQETSETFMISNDIFLR